MPRLLNTFTVTMVVIACGSLPMCESTTRAQDASSDSVIASEDGSKSQFPKFAEFASSWSDDQWVPRSGRRFVGHIRSLESDQWQLRMLALHEAVAAGEVAVPFLIDRLQQGKAHERILAAQPLGYLAKHAPMEPLLEALKNDEDSAVKLYAADALGMRGDAKVGERWSDFAGKIRNRDVRRHMGYAEERGGAPIEDAIVEQLANWDPATMNSAEVGKPAPDFELSTVGGETVKLSNYRGKKNVVLVFIYGDT